MDIQKIKNAEVLAEGDARRIALEIADAGLRAIDTPTVLRETIRLEGHQLCIGTNTCSLFETKRIFFVGIGKCAIQAALTLEEILGDTLSGGIVLDVSMPELCDLKKIECHVGSHPMPTEQNVEVTKKIVTLLKDLKEEDLVLVFISGGGSTLLCLPDEGATCIDEAIILKSLFNKGAGIQEINTVRKHLSLARGGHLARYAYPAQVIGLVFSDVPGNDISFVASGPTILDTTTAQDANMVLDKYDIKVAGDLKTISLLETPKDEKYFRRVQNILLVSNERALFAMAGKAKDLGFATSVCDSCLTGEARDVGRTIAEALHAVPSKSALLYGGETTVTIRGSGIGGRNQELALSALADIRENEIIITLASDGRDNSDAAGAVCDTITKEKAHKANLSIQQFLDTNDAYTFFQKTGDFLDTGHTGSNVSDLIIALKI